MMQPLAIPLAEPPLRPTLPTLTIQSGDTPAVVLPPPPPPVSAKTKPSIETTWARGCQYWAVAPFAPPSRRELAAADEAD